MPVMVFLKMASDLALLYMAGGPIVYGCGVPEPTIYLSLFLTALAMCFSFVLREKKALKYVPFVLTVIPLAFAGTGWIAWLVIAVFSLAYALFCAINDRYVGDAEHQKTMFKVAWGVLIGALLIALILSASSEQFVIIIICGIVALACSVLLLRSLRHEPEVYNSISFQAVNVGVVAVILAGSLLLSSKNVLNGIFAGIKTLYLGIATGFVYIVMFAIRWISRFISWIASLFGEISTGEEEEVQELQLNSAKDLFGDMAVNEAAGLPLWVKILGIVILALIALLLIYLIFKKMSGGKTAKTASASNKATVFSAQGSKKTAKEQSPAVAGVRKQYKNYLLFLKKQGQDITRDKTTEEIEKLATDIENQKSGKNQNHIYITASDELRDLYLKARYNEASEKTDADRAKVLVNQIKRTATKY